MEQYTEMQANVTLPRRLSPFGAQWQEMRSGQQCLHRASLPSGPMGWMRLSLAQPSGAVELDPTPQGTSDREAGRRPVGHPVARDLNPEVKY